MIILFTFQGMSCFETYFSVFVLEFPARSPGGLEVIPVCGDPHVKSIRGLGPDVVPETSYKSGLLFLKQGCKASNFE